MPEFFVELFSEEIPARMQKDAADKLLGIVEQLAFTPDSSNDPDFFFGPRRIAVCVEVPEQAVQPAAEIRGPKETAPKAAVYGFINKHSVSEQDLLIENGYYVLRKAQISEPMRDYIERVLPDWITSNLVWPKSMRWGQSGDFTWVRPLRRIVCLLGGEVIPIKLGPVTASNETEGHRFLAPGAFNVSSAKDWQDKLRAHYVIADQDERKQLIRDGLKTEAEKRGLSIAEDEGLLDEVTGLVEWPVVLIGKIDAAFMNLPPEVRELSMKVNQRYFALRDVQGQPAPYFAFVSNIEATDGGAQIIAGNQRVLRARLSDARHFWDLDLKTPLRDLLPTLEKITFHTKIGSQAARVNRIAILSRKIAETLGADKFTAGQAEWAGKLSKTDLVTGMVGEFPELQGIMGGYYAERNPCGWDGAIVGSAIRTHYQPKGPQDSVPTGIIPCAIALADKLDTLVQFFRIGEKPTGSGDPYALRRAALGVIRIILENKLALPLQPLLNQDQSLFDFIIERLRVKLRGEGRRFDILDAVLGAGTDDDLVRIMRKVDAVTDFLNRTDGANLLATYRRAANILRIEDAKDGPHGAKPVNGPLLSQTEEDFRDMLSFTRSETISDFHTGNYERAMSALAKLRTVVDVFFDKVTVNAPESELRCNRLALLAQLRDTMHLIADFSKIEA